MTFSSPAETQLDALRATYDSASLLGQTLIYGVYAAFFPFALFLLLRNFKANAVNKIMLTAAICSFALSTGYWISSLVTFFHKMKNDLIDLRSPEERGINRLTEVMNLLDAIALLNFVFTDSVVLWRAWVICRDFSKAKYILFSAMMTLGLCLGCSLTSIALRSVVLQSILALKGDLPHTADRALSYVQVITLGFSLLTNLLATGCVGWRHWAMRQSARELYPSRPQVHRTKTPAIYTLAILVESGAIYCGIAILVLITTKIPLSINMLGSLCIPVQVQIAGLYPLLVMVLVHVQHSTRTHSGSTNLPPSSTVHHATLSWHPARRSDTTPSSGSMRDDDDYALSGGGERGITKGEKVFAV